MGAVESSVASTEVTGPSRISTWRKRFRAWWEGYEPAPPEHPGQDPQADNGPPIEPEPAAETFDGPAIWSDSRIEVVEGLWGHGLSSPGEADHVKQLIRPIVLNPKKRVLDIGVGLGGTSRVIASETGAWVTGLIFDPDLVAVANQRSSEEGLAKKAVLRAFEPPALDVRDKYFDAVVAKDSLYAVAEKEELFQGIFDALKSDGHLLFTDYMVPDSSADSSGLAQWITGETPRPAPCSLGHMTKILSDLGFDIRVSEDITDQVRQLVPSGWAAFAQNLKPKSLSPEVMAAVAAEGEFWARRLALMESGDLVCYRVHAIKHVSEIK